MRDVPALFPVSLWLAVLFSLFTSACQAGDILPGHSQARGFYSPIFDPEEGRVTYVQRDVQAWDWGPGWEHFTPPALVRVTRDTFRLMELDLGTGKVHTLRTFPESPLVGGSHRHYRNRLYGLPRVLLRYESTTGQLEYEIEVRIMGQPLSTPYRVYRRWNTATEEMEEPPEWQQDIARMQGPNEDRLRGDTELISVPGPRGVPCAIAAWDHASGGIAILAKSEAFSEQYPDGVSQEVLASHSQKEMIERNRIVRSDRERFYQGFLAQGMREGEARLAASEEMQRIGHFPKAPTMTALVVGPEIRASDLPVFGITPTEMQSGIFTDIEEAIGKPGTAVKRRWSRYIIYQGYDTSERLNAHLETGANRYRVRYRGRTYEIEVEKNP